MENVNCNNEMNMDDFEKNEIAELENKKTSWFGDPKLPIKKRIYQWIAKTIVLGIAKFGTNLRWQTMLVIYLAIVCPVGTWSSIKWIINLFF